MQAAAQQDDYIPTSVRGCECNEQSKGEQLKAAKCRELSPLPSRLTPRHLPRKRGRLKLLSKLGVQCRTPSRSDRFNGVTGGAGGLRGEIEIFPGPLQKGYIVTHSYLFTSTPQSIAKPSPGWNKVTLLTAVRNSPCSCPFSVSLHPPLAALNSEPRPGSLLGWHICSNRAARRPYSNQRSWLRM